MVECQPSACPLLEALSIQESLVSRRYLLVAYPSFLLHVAIPMSER